MKHPEEFAVSIFVEKGFALTNHVFNKWFYIRCATNYLSSVVIQLLHFSYFSLFNFFFSETFSLFLEEKLSLFKEFWQFMGKVENGVGN